MAARRFVDQLRGFLKGTEDVPTRPIDSPVAWRALDLRDIASRVTLPERQRHSLVYGFRSADQIAPNCLIYLM